MRDEIRVIEDPAVLSISLEPTRSEILQMLSKRDMTIIDLADRLDKHPTTVYRHVKKLEDNDYVYVSGVKWKSHSSEYVYGRTAQLFIPDCRFMNGNGMTKMRLVWEEGQVDRVVELLEKIGYHKKTHGIERDIYRLFTELDDRFCERVKEIDDNDGLSHFDFLTLKRLLLLMSIVNDGDIKGRIESIFSNFEETD